MASALVLGLCGALDPALRVGEPTVYTQISAGAQLTDLDPDLTAACLRSLQCAAVRVADAPAVVGDQVGKAALRGRTGADVVDMEAASIASALHARGVRVAMVRVVSDDATSDMPDLRNVYDAQGALRPFALTSALVWTPVRSVRFIRNALRALNALRTTAGRLSA